MTERNRLGLPENSLVKRRLLNVMAGASLMLCLVMVGIWIRSYFYVDHRVFQSPRVGVGFLSQRGECYLLLYTPTNPPMGYTIYHKSFQLGRGNIVSPPIGPNALGFGFYHARNKVGGIATVTTVPFWAVVIGLAILPALRVRSLGAARWGEGCCQMCGYDVRATPERCPECGAVPKQAEAEV